MHPPYNDMQGFNKPTKQLLLKNLALEVAKEHNVDEELSQKLFERMFKDSIENNDFPITSVMLKPVIEHLKTTLKKHDLHGEKFDVVLDDWRIACLTNNLRDRSKILPHYIQDIVIRDEDQENADRNLKLKDILKNFAKSCITPAEFIKPKGFLRKLLYSYYNHDFKDNFILKAPILKGLIDDHQDEFKKLSKTNLPKDHSVEYYYNKLCQAQRINNEKYLLSKSAKITKGIDYKISKQQLEEKFKDPKFLKELISQREKFKENLKQRSNKHRQ